MRVISISNIQCGLLKKGTTWFHITYKRKHQQIETVLKTANIWAKGSFSYIAQIEKANLQMPHASFLALIQLFARSHSCLYFPLWQCLTIIVNSVFSHSRVFFLQPLNCHNPPLWRRFGGGLWRGRCFRNEHMSHEDWTHAKTAGRTICMNSLWWNAIDDKSSPFCLISVTTSDNKYHLSDAITGNVFCHLVVLIVSCHLRRARHGLTVTMTAGENNIPLVSFMDSALL